MSVLVEFRCPRDERRKFGEAEGGGDGEVMFRCRDCRRRNMTEDPEWHGQIIHVFTMDGVCVATQILTANLRIR